MSVSGVAFDSVLAQFWHRHRAGTSSARPIRAQNVEATSGFEPLNRGFADRSIPHATHDSPLSGPLHAAERRSVLALFWHSGPRIARRKRGAR